MSTVRIPAKKVMEPGVNLNDIEYIWDYIDMYVEEEAPNVHEPCLDDEYDYNDEYYDCDDSWEDYDGPYMSDKKTGTIMMPLRATLKQFGVESGKFCKNIEPQ